MGVGLGGSAGALVLVALLPWLVEEGEHPLSLCNTGGGFTTCWQNMDDLHVP